MRRTITRIGAVGAGTLLALGLFAVAPPAGASDGHGAKTEKGGKAADKAEKPDKPDKAATPEKAEGAEHVTCLVVDGHTQGRSRSDPDGMSNNGADKPGCDGGFDMDKDGNNGCGNDADREDDNNGHCGRKPAGTPTDTPPGTVESEDDDSVNAASSDTSGDTAVLAAGVNADDGVVSGAADDVSTTSPDSSVQVLGETLERPDTLPSALPRTGAGIVGLTLLGSLLFGGGRLALLARRFLRIG